MAMHRQISHQIPSLKKNWKRISLCSWGKQSKVENKKPKYYRYHTYTNHPLSHGYHWSNTFLKMLPSMSCLKITELSRHEWEISQCTCLKVMNFKHDRTNPFYHLRNRIQVTTSIRKSSQCPSQFFLFVTYLIRIPFMICNHEVSSCSLYIVISCCLKYRLSSSSTNTRFKKYFTLNLLLMLRWVGVSS